MIDNLLLLDVSLALALVAIGTGVLIARGLFPSIVLFIVFGMLRGIARCRLRAVDVALAEVPIGAGLTGALLLNTLAATRPGTAVPPPATLADPPVPHTPPADIPVSHTPRADMPRSPTTRTRSPTRAVMPVGRRLGLACGMALWVAIPAGSLATVVMMLGRQGSPPRIAVADALPQSGLDHPVTAVLLNVRAHDTLLEVAVLVAAVLPVLAVPEARSPARETAVDPAGPVLGAFARLLVPLGVLVAAYVLWRGAKGPGGAFQAAAILTAGGVLLVLCGTRPPRGMQLRWRILLAVGPGVFLFVGTSGIAAGGWFPELPPRWA